jgi:hypothetical protein
VEQQSRHSPKKYYDQTRGTYVGAWETGLDAWEVG